MDVNILQEAWSKQTVNRVIEPVPVIAARLEGEIAAAQRRIRGGIVLASIVLSLGWVIGIVGHVLGIKTLTPLGLAANVVQCLFFVAFLWRAIRSFQVVRREKEMTGGTLRESLNATRRTVEVQLQNARIAAWAIPVVIAVNAWLYLAKYFAGEFPGFGVIAATGFMALIGAAIGGAIWFRYRAHLAPLHEELVQQLRGFEVVE